MVKSQLRNYEILFRIWDIFVHVYSSTGFAFVSVEISSRSSSMKLVSVWISYVPTSKALNKFCSHSYMHCSKQVIYRSTLSTLHGNNDNSVTCVRPHYHYTALPRIKRTKWDNEPISFECVYFHLLTEFHSSQAIKDTMFACAEDKTSYSISVSREIGVGVGGQCVGVQSPRTFFLYERRWRPWIRSTFFKNARPSGIRATKSNIFILCACERVWTFTL